MVQGTSGVIPVTEALLGGIPFRTPEAGVTGIRERNEGEHEPVSSVLTGGIRGPEGADGIRGPEGADGIRGPWGADGIRGPEGADGIRAPGDRFVYHPSFISS
jgi:hypothetical protein